MLQYAHPFLKSLPDVVNFAVQQNGCALQYASPAIQNDIEIVKNAIGDV